MWLTHEDADHTESFQRIMEAAPNATLVTHTFSALRMGTWWPVPMEQVHAIRFGDEIHVGNRTLTAVPGSDDRGQMRTLAVAQHKLVRAVELLLEGRSYEDIARHFGYTTHREWRIELFVKHCLIVRSRLSTSCGYKNSIDSIHCRLCSGP